MNGILAQGENVANMQFSFYVDVPPDKPKPRLYLCFRINLHKGTDIATIT